MTHQTILTAAWMAPATDRSPRRAGRPEKKAPVSWEDRLRTLKAHLRDEDPDIRRTAASALGFMGPAAADAAPALSRALDDADATVRRLAARALGRMGLSADAHGPALVGMF